MRELKFKAFHLPSKQMYWFDLTWGNHGHGNGWIGMVEWGKEQTEDGKPYRWNMVQVDPDDCEIMEFTGLFDKNSVEIYEGDILNYRQSDGEFDNDYSFEVVFKNGAFRSWSTDAVVYEIIRPLRINEITKIEVVGNVYENPELTHTS